MKITLYNAKGGVGKTCIALHLALEMACGIVTNDIFSPLETVLPEESVLKVATPDLARICNDWIDDYPEIPNDVNVIYDLKGWLDDRTRKVIMKSDWVVVPTLASPLDLQVTSESIRQVMDLNDRFVIIINKTAKNEFSKARKELERSFDIPVFEIQQSDVVSGIFANKESLWQMMERGEEQSRLYKTVYLQLEAIIKHLRGW